MRVLLTHLCHPGHCQGVYHNTIWGQADRGRGWTHNLSSCPSTDPFCFGQSLTACRCLLHCTRGWPSSLIIHAGDCFLGITSQPELLALLHFCNFALEPIPSPTLHLGLNIICRNNNWAWIWFAKIIMEVAFHLQRIFDKENTSAHTNIKARFIKYDAIHTTAVVNWSWIIWRRTSLHKDWNEPLVLCLKFKLNWDKRTTMETECSYLPFELLNPLVQRVQLLLLLLARSLCSAQALLKLLNLEKKKQ